MKIYKKLILSSLFFLIPGIVLADFTPFPTGGTGGSINTNPLGVSYITSTSTATSSFIGSITAPYFIATSTTDHNIFNGQVDMPDVTYFTQGLAGISGGTMRYHVAHDSAGGEWEYASANSIGFTLGTNNQYSANLQLGGTGPYYETIDMQYNGFPNYGIIDCTLVNGGSGYQAGDVVAVSGGNGDAGFTIFGGNLTGGVITNLTNPSTGNTMCHKLNGNGSGYQVANGVSLTGGHGSGATINITNVATNRPSKKVIWGASYMAPGGISTSEYMGQQVFAASTTGLETMNFYDNDPGFGSENLNNGHGAQFASLNKNNFTTTAFVASSTTGTSTLPIISSTFASTSNQIVSGVLTGSTIWSPDNGGVTLWVNSAQNLGLSITPSGINGRGSPDLTGFQHIVTTSSNGGSTASQPGVNLSNVGSGIFASSSNLAFSNLGVAVAKFGTNGTFIEYGSSMTVSTSTGAGVVTGGTASITGGANNALLSLTTGTGPATSATVMTVTLADGCPNAPVPVLYPANANTATLSGVSMVFASSTASTTFTITSGTSALTGGIPYLWNLHVACR